MSYLKAHIFLLRKEFQPQRHGILVFAIIEISCIRHRTIAILEIFPISFLPVRNVLLKLLQSFMKENEYMIFLLVYKTVANRGPQIIVEYILSYCVFSLPNICFEWNQNNTMFGIYFLNFHFSKKGSVYGSESEKSRLLKQTAEWPHCRWISRNYSQFSPKPFGGLRTHIAVWWWVSFQMSCTYWMNYTLCRSHTCSVFFDSKQSKFHTPTRNKLSW